MIIKTISRHRILSTLMGAEVFANSSPAVVQRRAFSGAIATEYSLEKHFNAFVSVGYDSDHLKNIRPGFNLEF